MWHFWRKQSRKERVEGSRGITRQWLDAWQGGVAGAGQVGLGGAGGRDGTRGYGLSWGKGWGLARAEESPVGMPAGRGGFGVGVRKLRSQACPATDGVRETAAQVGDTEGGDAEYGDGGEAPSGGAVFGVGQGAGPCAELVLVLL